MELVVINENKLKVMMNETDMKIYGLDENEFYCSITNARDILRKIIKNSPVRTGFEDIPIDEKILIQLYPDKTGGCELYITRISLDEKEDDTFMPQENDERYLLPKPIIKKQGLKIPLLSYKFDNLEFAMCAAKEMYRRNYNGASSFYRDQEGKYFLFVNNLKNEGAEYKNVTDFLSEFGELTNTENTRLALSERGKCIFKENAVKQLTEI